MLQHKQVRVNVGQSEADVDEELAPLVEELWKADISTVLSCQENRPGVAWIMFDMPGDVCKFIDIVAEYDSESGSLYRRITGRDDEGCWEYDLLPEDAGLCEEEEGGEIVEWHEGQVAFYFNTSVRFPRTDLPILLDRLKRHNESGSCAEEEMVPLCPECPDEIVLEDVDYGDGLFWFSCPVCGKLFMEAEVLWEEESALFGDQL